MRVSEIPGYIRAQTRADRIEDYWRDFAFLGMPEEICFPGGKRITVNLLTLRMYIQLSAVRSPFIVGGRINPEHVAQILWRLSPKYDKRDPKNKVRTKFVKEIAVLPFKSSVRIISRFLDRMFTDKPPAQVSEKNTKKSDSSFAAWMIHKLASAYGWTDDAILDMPIPRLFQYLRNIQRQENPELIHFNPLRDKMTNRVAKNFFEKRRLVRAATSNNGHGH